MKTSPRTQGRSPCIICKQMVSNNGFGRTSHMRKHARNDEAVEIEAPSAKYPLKVFIANPNFVATILTDSSSTSRNRQSKKGGSHE